MSGELRAYFSAKLGPAFDAAYERARARYEHKAACRICILSHQLPYPVSEWHVRLKVGAGAAMRRQRPEIRQERLTGDRLPAVAGTGIPLCQRPHG